MVDVKAAIADMEAAGCPYSEQSRYQYTMLERYSIAPFAGTPDTWPAYFEDDVLYFRLLDELYELPYLIKRVNENIKRASKKPRR